MARDWENEALRERVVALERAVQVLIGLIASLRGPELEAAVQAMRRRAVAEASREAQAPPDDPGFRALTRLAGLFEHAEDQTVEELIEELFEGGGE